MNDIEEAKRLLLLNYHPLTNKNIEWTYHPFDSDKKYPQELYIFQLIDGDYIFSYNGEEEKMSFDECFERSRDFIRQFK